MKKDERAKKVLVACRAFGDARDDYHYKVHK